VIIAEATNMGLGAKAESCGVPYDVLAWTAEWYFRAETLEAANAAIVNYHHRLPMTQAFGTGTLSSSDGQQFPVKGKSLTARHLSRYFARGQGISTYTHVSDQHSTFDTKVIAFPGVACCRPRANSRNLAVTLARPSSISRFPGPCASSSSLACAGPGFSARACTRRGSPGRRPGRVMRMPRLAASAGRYLLASTATSAPGASRSSGSGAGPE
jgi:hypothetical protein